MTDDNFYEDEYDYGDCDLTGGENDYFGYGSIQTELEDGSSLLAIDAYGDEMMTRKGVKGTRSSTTLMRLREKRLKMVWISFLSLALLCFVFFVIYSDTKTSPHDGLQRHPPMQRSILLVLEAETVPVNPIIDDMDRQLSTKGMRDAEGLGVYLSEHKIPEPEWIFSSPSERTAYTTELIRRHWSPDVTVAFEDVLYILEFNDYFTFVEGLNDHFRRVMIVGHNPAILKTAKKLLRTHGIDEFPDCGLLEIVWEDLVEWKDVRLHSGSSTLAIDPHNKFYFSSPKAKLVRGRSAS